MPRWLRWLQPLLSGVFTVDNLDYVRRDAYLIGVSTGPVDVERLRRYCFVGPRGLSLYEPGLGALEMFLTARLFMYQQIYFHRSVRAIDLDLAEVFRPSIAGHLRRGLAGGRPGPLRRPGRVRAAPPGRAVGPGRGAIRPPDAGRRDGHARGGPGLVGDPAAPAALARRGRDPPLYEAAEREARAWRRCAAAGAGGARPAWRSTWPRSTPARPRQRPPTRCWRSSGRDGAPAAPLSAVAGAAARLLARGRRYRPLGLSRGRSGRSDA